MNFDIVYLLSLILLMLFAVIAILLAYPGPKHDKHSTR